MRIKRLIILVVAVVGLMVMGCSTNKVANSSIPEVEKYIIPNIGTEATAYIGDHLLKEGTTCSDDAIYLLKSFGKEGWTAYHAVGLYKLKGTTNSGDRIYQGSDKTSNGWSSVYSQIVEKSDGKFYLKANSGEILLNSNDFRKEKYVFDASKEFQQTLIYTGSTGSILKFTYREFSNDMARPAFTTDITYDMNESNIIGYKSFRAEVIEATNTEIKYKIIQGFNK